MKNWYMPKGEACVTVTNVPVVIESLGDTWFFFQNLVQTYTYVLAIANEATHDYSEASQLNRVNV